MKMYRDRTGPCETGGFTSFQLLARQVKYIQLELDLMSQTKPKRKRHLQKAKKDIVSFLKIQKILFVFTKRMEAIYMFHLQFWLSQVINQINLSINRLLIF